jgi:SMP-30/Gluconolactonase/LRE-like region
VGAGLAKAKPRADVELSLNVGGDRHLSRPLPLAPVSPASSRFARPLRRVNASAAPGGRQDAGIEDRLHPIGPTAQRAEELPAGDITYRVDVFDYDLETGLTGGRAFVDRSAEAMRPDGLTVDSEGGVWVALSNGGTVRRSTPGGRLVELPVRKVTACTFGDPHLDQLFITASREGSSRATRWLARCSGPCSA